MGPHIALFLLPSHLCEPSACPWMILTGQRRYSWFSPDHCIMSLTWGFQVFFLLFFRLLLSYFTSLFVEHYLQMRILYSQVVSGNISKTKTTHLINFTALKLCTWYEFFFLCTAWVLLLLGSDNSSLHCMFYMRIINLCNFFQDIIDIQCQCQSPLFTHGLKMHHHAHMWWLHLSF